MVSLRLLKSAELTQVQDIDVSESGSLVYHTVDGKLASAPEVWQRSRRTAEQWKPYVEKWKTHLAQGGAAIGAFDSTQLVGLAVLRARLAEGVAELAALFVSKAYRRQGIATRLVQEIARLATDSGAGSLYVSATPSESAVGFYTRQGFTLAQQVNQELYELEPEDIHMIRIL